MSNIVDYKCTYDFSVGISSEVTKELGLEFPFAYTDRNSMKLLSLALKKNDDVVFCEIPFCHTLEAEAFGGDIKLGDERFGPRCNSYVFSDFKDLINLPDIDCSKGRVKESLLAASDLSELGEHVVFHVTGPLTILDALIDPMQIFKTMRKNKELAFEVFKNIALQTLTLMKEAYNHGVRIISYADSSGGVNILGPKLMEEVIREVMYDFLKTLDNELPKDMLIILCPKLTYALTGCELAKLVGYKLDEDLDYGSACVAMIGKTRYLGHTCIKNINSRLANQTIRALELQ